MRLQAERDEAFMCNLDYLVERNNSAGKLIEVIEGESSVPPKNFICFTRDDTRFYVKKASLIWWLSAEGKRVSPDRVWRFVNDREQQTDIALQTGDFIEMHYKKANHIVQVLGFRFVNGKPFHGDRYEGRDKREVEALCIFFGLNDGIISADENPPIYVNVKNRKKRIFLKPDFETGHLRLV